MTEHAGEFEGKQALVTGAGKGIGRATARLLARRGAKVLAVSRSAEDLASLQTEIGGRSFPVDLADAEATRAVVRAALPFDLLVNCAGATTLQPFVDLTTETFERIIAVNTTAPMIIAQEYARDRIARALPGSIVNVSSDAAFVGVIDHTAYCASKGALDAMSRVMANELGPHRIRVNCINPNITLTDMARKAWSDPGRAGPRLARLPLGRFLEPDEVAEAIVYLLSDRAAMITGVSLQVDGGFSVTYIRATAASCRAPRTYERGRAFMLPLMISVGTPRRLCPWRRTMLQPAGHPEAGLNFAWSSPRALKRAPRRIDTVCPVGLLRVAPTANSRQSGIVFRLLARPTPS